MTGVFVDGKCDTMIMAYGAVMGMKMEDLDILEENPLTIGDRDTKDTIRMHLHGC